MYDEYGSQGFVPIGIDIFQPMDSAKVKARLYTFPILDDANGILCWPLYDISNSIPTNYVIDPDGIVRYGAVGFNEAATRDTIEKYMTGVAESPAVNPIEFSVVGANPVVGQSAVRFGLPKAANVSLRVFSTSGALVRTLVDGQMPAGANTVNWNLQDNAGRQVGNGLYLYELNVGSQVAHAKVSVLK
jgi:hypothetical protein